MSIEQLRLLLPAALYRLGTKSPPRPYVVAWHAMDFVIHPRFPSRGLPVNPDRQKEIWWTPTESPPVADLVEFLQRIRSSPEAGRKPKLCPSVAILLAGDIPLHFNLWDSARNLSTRMTRDSKSVRSDFLAEELPPESSDGSTRISHANLVSIIEGLVRNL